MRRLAAKFGAVFLVLASASVSQAATIFDSGSFGADESFQLLPLGDFDAPAEYKEPGKYRFTLDFSTPVASVNGEVLKVVTFNEFCREDDMVFFCGGNNFEVTYPLNQRTPTQYIADVRLNREKSVASSGSIARTDTFEECCYAMIDVRSANAGTYTFSASAIPEPATWLMLLLGFGGVGASMRASRYRRLRPTEA